MAGEYVLVDALPYCDSGYEEPGVKQAVNKSFVLFLLLIWGNFIFLIGNCFSRRRM